MTIITFIIAVFAFPKTLFAFGITPAEIYIEDIKPGSHYETEIYVTRPVTEANEKLKVIIEPDLGDMVSWCTFIPGKEFDFPSGKNTTSFKVAIDVPQNAPLNNFKGQITIKGLSEKKANEGVTMVKGAVLGVNITTSNSEVLSMKVLSIEAPQVNAGDPVRLLLNIQNLGNTAVAPDRVDMEIMDLFEKPKESLSVSKLDKVEPFSTKEIKADFDSNLEKGQYRVDASVVFQGKEIFTKRMVLTVNAKPAKPEIQTPEISEGTVVNQAGRAGIILAIFGILMLIIVLLLYFRGVKLHDPDFEKRLTKLMHENRMVTWFLVITSVAMVLAGLYIHLTTSNSIQITAEKPSVTEKISPTVTPTKSVSEKSVKATNVKGASTEAEEFTTVPFVVSNSGTPGLYPVYADAAFDSDIIYEANDGETFKVTSQNGDWYKVLLDGGSSGWLHSSSIKKKNQ